MLAARMKMTMIMASMALPLNWQTLQRKPSSRITVPPTSSAALVVGTRCGCGIGRGIGARATSSQNWQQHHNPPEFHSDDGSKDEYDNEASNKENKDHNRIENLCW
jgi:hypothetical protein